MQRRRRANDAVFMSAKRGESTWRGKSYERKTAARVRQGGSLGGSDGDAAHETSSVAQAGCGR